MKEKYYDELLNINTAANRKGFSNSVHYHRYEPTPYIALEELFNQYELNRNDRIVDFGCGKGRLNFYIHYLFNATVVGIEMNQKLYEEAVDNRENFIKKYQYSGGKVHFCCCLAEDYQINPADNRFYFFNPFSIQIFRTIVNNILYSVEHSKRKIELILYYVSEEYTYFLDNHPSFCMKQEIKLSGIYEQNPYERFLIYQLSY